MKGFKHVCGNIGFILRYVWRVSPLFFLVACFESGVHALIVFFEHTYMRKFILDCIQYQRPFFYAALYIAGVFVTVTAFLYSSGRYAQNGREKHQMALIRALRLDIFKRAAGLDMMCYDDPTFYNDFVWAMNESESRAFGLLGSVSGTMTSLSWFVTCGTLMAVSDPLGFVFVGVVFASSTWLGSYTKKLDVQLQNELRPAMRKRDYIHRVLYLNDYAKELRLNSVKQKLDDDYTVIKDDLVAIVKRRSRQLAILSFINDYCLNYVVMSIVYALYLLHRTVVLENLSYGTLVALLGSAGGVRGGLRGLTQAYPAFQEHSLYVQKIRDFLAYTPSIQSIDTPTALPQAPAAVVFDNVSFQYGDTPVLQNVSFRVEPGEKIAIVGYNGAGKSTLVKLLLRLYDPVGGTISYGDTPITDFAVDDYRMQFGVVFQDYQLFAATLRQNVVCDTENADSATVTSALTQSGFGAKLADLPHGLDTSITKEFDENGTELSGGEAQKVAIARILYKNSRIMVLDEPSSALDPISEYELNRTFAEFDASKTVFIISHRLSTTRMADRILVLNDGKIVESGSHTHLMEQNGIYARMFNLQAEKYRQATEQ